MYRHFWQLVPVLLEVGRDERRRAECHCFPLPAVAVLEADLAVVAVPPGAIWGCGDATVCGQSVTVE